MSFLNTYKKYIVSNGSNTKESMTKTFIEDSYKLMKTNPSYFEVQINDSAELVPALIIDDSKNEEFKQISLAPSYSLKRGDYVSWDGKIWLVTIVDNQGDVYYRGRMLLCSTEELKWIDNEGNIFSYPCVFDYGTKANFGVYFDKFMTLPDGRRQVTVTSNEHTKKIIRDMRFIFGGRAFVVIDHDYVSDDGLVHINLKDTQLNPATDNLELRIADYYKRAANYTIKFLNGSSLLIDEYQDVQLNVEVLNNGIKVEKPQIEFTFDSDIVNVSDSGLLKPLRLGSTQVVARYKGVIAVININITDNRVNNYSVQIDGSEFIYQEMTKQYKAIFKNNGKEFSEVAQFTLTDINGDSTTLAEIISTSENSCSIKASKGLGKVLLHVQNSNGLIKNSKEISIKSLI